MTTLDETIKSSKVIVHDGRYAYLKAQETEINDHFLISKDNDEITVDDVVDIILVEWEIPSESPIPTFAYVRQVALVEHGAQPVLQQFASPRRGVCRPDDVAA